MNISTFTMGNKEIDFESFAILEDELLLSK